jgi:hypothetical protein
MNKKQGFWGGLALTAALALAGCGYGGSTSNNRPGVGPVPPRSDRASPAIYRITSPSARTDFYVGEALIPPPCRVLDGRVCLAAFVPAEYPQG